MGNTEDSQDAANRAATINIASNVYEVDALIAGLTSHGTSLASKIFPGKTVAGKLLGNSSSHHRTFVKKGRPSGPKPVPF